MKDKKEIQKRVALRRFFRRLRSIEKRKLKRKKQHLIYLLATKPLEGNKSYETVFAQCIPTNLSYLISCRESDFYIEKLYKCKFSNNGTFEVPEEFSLVDYPEEGFKFIQQVTAALILQKYPIINIDYGICKRADLGAQVFLDIILKDIISLYKRIKVIKPSYVKVKEINGTNFKSEEIRKLLFSVGSPAIHSKRSFVFKDIIPYKLCIHDREINGDPVKIREQKDLDTTTLVDYVLDCLKTLSRTLTPEKLDDLSTVIGEILINAEEHSTTKYRFSIGYFHETNSNGKHFGVFRLAILNFGKTIYEKFKDPNCPNKDVVEKMTSLSERYTKKSFFRSREFDEETLWTLYALQDGVTSVAPERFKKRGNGSIQFIESFFNIKGKMKEEDDISRMAIISGNTSILFDGSYNINTKEIDDEPFKFMTFNNSGSIEDKPDNTFVKFVKNYFPGTIISAKILFNEDDLKEENYETK